MQRQINHTRSDRRPDKAGEQQAAEIAGREAGMPQAPPEIVWLADRLKRLADRLLPCIPALILQVLGAGQDVVGQFAAHPRPVRRPVQVAAYLIEKTGDAVIRGHMLHLRPPCRTVCRTPPTPGGSAPAFSRPAASACNTDGGGPRRTLVHRSGPR